VSRLWLLSSQAFAEIYQFSSVKGFRFFIILDCFYQLSSPISQVFVGFAEFSSIPLRSISMDYGIRVRCENGTISLSPDRGVDQLLLQCLYRIQLKCICLIVLLFHTICVSFSPWIADVAVYPCISGKLDGSDSLRVCLLLLWIEARIDDMAPWSLLSFPLLFFLQTPSKFIQFHCFRSNTPTPLWKTYKKG
jgi:hypothetical protein